jgi:hypothetical protein
MYLNSQKIWVLTSALVILIMFSTFVYAQGLESALGKAGGFNKKEESEPSKNNNQSQQLFSGQIGSYDEFVFYEKQCRAQVEISCIKAAQIMMSLTPPQRIFDMSTSARTQRALSLFEIAINKQHLEAMEYAYDIYYIINPIERALNPNADTVRANELLDQMLSKNYSGGLARQAQDFILNPEYLLSLEKKSIACKNLKLLSGNSGLTAKTKEIIDDLNASLVCKLLR